jgi:plasmid stabilization system protein ParE
MLSPFASRDLDELISYLDGLPLEPANRIGSSVRRMLENIGENPLRGPEQSELTRIMGFEVRSRLVASYRVLYRVGSTVPEIIGILHAARDIPAIMAERVR